ncbi:hypothetical protein ACG04R_27970 [Roseateles sp. BYS78W]|uniref:ABC-type transport auxiliary lipoprotein component domain-containing protein n=1 Tax=Pelomonas candidula TaxID=3299025 RepID=A0ABW7HKS0_9BURK
MRRRIAVLFLLCSLILASCAVRDAKTSGDAKGAIGSTKLSLNLELPKAINISRTSSVKGGSSISEQDKQRALSDSRALVSVMFKGFTERFPTMAKSYGLRIDPASQSESILRLSVTALHLDCTDMGCRPNLEIRAIVLRSDNYATLWTYTSNVGTATVLSAVSDELFESFAKDMLQAMERDHVLSKQ